MALEIERKFLIKMPDLKWIEKNTVCEKIQIVQTYLGKNSNGFGDRVREIELKNNKKKYFHTAKNSLSGITRFELEKEISKKEYEMYLENKKNRLSLKKTRYIVKLNSLKYEIDVYPFWKSTAILEIELKSEKQKFDIPEFIKIIGEVTNNLDYSNQSLAKKYIE